MKAPLNEYGDRLIATTGVHGGDIALQRMDELDRRALSDVLAERASACTTADLGCGFGMQGLRFALLGARSHLFDLLPEPSIFGAIREQTNIRLSYVSGDLRQLAATGIPDDLDVVFSQRFIHYLEFEQASRLIATVASKARQGARFYISASGLESELGSGYSAHRSDLSERFDFLSADLQAKHGMRERVCLYTEVDLKTLMSNSGLSAVEVWSSSFGNVKGVFAK
jgi:SAM-dependent methyltransferase